MSDSGKNSPTIPPFILFKDTGQEPPQEPPDFGKAALGWYRFGLQVIPICPGSKVTALKWDSWLEDLSEEKIIAYWSKHPDHEVGFIVGDDLIVFDADSPQAIMALTAIEKEYNVEPTKASETRKGVHHYFRLAQGTYVKSDAHSTVDHPERIDIKTGRAMVVLPPSTGKKLTVDIAKNTKELSEVGQGFIDSVYLMNGREMPRPPKLSPELRPKLESSSESIAKLSGLLEGIDSDCGYDDWTRIIMGIYHETCGSEEGLDLADAWSSRGSKYKGRREIEAKWRSFREVPNPVTIASLIKMAKDNGAVFEKGVAASESQFQVCKTETIYPAEISPEQSYKNPFTKFSLTGRSDILEKKMREEKRILAQVALSGQMSIWYAAPNTGKTLLMLWLLIAGISKSLIDPVKTFYLNVDDTGRGLLTKVKIAEEHGFEMLAEGYNGFRAIDFLGMLQKLTDDDQATGVVIVLDTLKKFVDLMHKRASSEFAAILRAFVLKGGTIIALAHTNKRKTDSGKSVYAGTSDVVDDADCVYILETVTSEGGEKIIEFENIKRRGNVSERAAYAYNSEPGLSYLERLMSIRAVDLEQLEPMKQAEAMRTDAEVIEAVITCINEGINTKMLLAEAAAKRSGASKRFVLQLIEKYTGDDPAQHRWTFTRGERGKMTYKALEVPRDK